MIHKTNWTGIWLNDQAGNLTYQINGNQITITFPKVLAKGEMAGNIINTVALPQIIWPSDYRYSQLRVQVNGSLNINWGCVQIDPTGFLGIGIDANWQSFDTTAIAGFFSQSIVYTL